MWTGWGAGGIEKIENASKKGPQEETNGGRGGREGNAREREMAISQAEKM